LKRIWEISLNEEFDHEKERKEIFDGLGSSNLTIVRMEQLHPSFEVVSLLEFDVNC